MMQRRRRRRGRGWGIRGNADSTPSGVTMMQPRRWDTPTTTTASSSSDPHQHFRGLLSMLIEFLFGPDDQFDGTQPSENDRWNLRALKVIQERKANNGISMEQLLPYADFLPTTITDVSQALMVATRYNGLSVSSATSSPAQKLFYFLELLTEAETEIQLSSSVDGSQTDGHSLSAMLFDAKILLLSCNLKTLQQHYRHIYSSTITS